MIWESTLKKITDETALRAALKWVDHPSKLELINNQINCVYRFEQNNQGYYLRITHEQIRPYKELIAATHFQNHLFNHNVPVCQAIPSQFGSLIETIKQDNLEFLAHVCPELPGSMISFEHTNKQIYISWGQALAKLHEASRIYQPQEHHFRSWKDLWQETAQYSKNEDQEIKTIFHQIDEWFKQLKVNSDNFGLTHGDHRPGNIICDGNQIQLIDFDEPVYHWYMADIAKPFLDLCAKPYSEWKQLFDWYIEGYQSIRPIQAPDLGSINRFTQMKSLDIYLWCKNNWHEATAPGGKPRDLWLHELRKMATTPLFPIK